MSAGALRLRAEALEESEEVFARDGIEAGAGFVEDEQPRPRHERAGDEDALAFALGEDAPRRSARCVASTSRRSRCGGGAVGGADAAPVVDHGVLPQMTEVSAGSCRGSSGGCWN